MHIQDPSDPGPDRTPPNLQPNRPDWSPVPLSETTGGLEQGRVEIPTQPEGQTELKTQHHSRLVTIRNPVTAMAGVAVAYPTVNV